LNSKVCRETSSSHQCLLPSLAALHSSISYLSPGESWWSMLALRIMEAFLFWTYLTSSFTAVKSCLGNQPWKAKPRCGGISVRFSFGSGSAQTRSASFSWRSGLLFLGSSISTRSGGQDLRLAPPIRRFPGSAYCFIVVKRLQDCQ